MTQPLGELPDDLTPDWLQGINTLTALRQLVFDIGKLSADLVMLGQRAQNLLVFVEQENVENDTG